MDYAITAFRHDQFDAYAQFKQRMGDPWRDSVTEQRRKWWCFDNPHGGLFAFAHTDSEIAATCYLAGKRLSPAFGGRPEAFEIGETWTAEQHRRKGLFSRLVEHCTAHAFATGAVLVYGTPNQQSTPGYAKLKYEIVDDTSSQLRMLANPVWLALSRQRLQGEDDLAAAGARAQRSSPLEISAADYLADTEDADHFTAGDSVGRTWRLANNPKSYRFFRLGRSGRKLLCAMRLGILGDLPVLVVGEAWMDGERAAAADLAGALRRVAASAYAGTAYAGVYWHGGEAAGAAQWRLNLALCKFHRQLPLCVKTDGSVAAEVLRARFRKFQLADCDIG
jgi:GNAT superfamily N-acetyltransferase